MIIVGERLNSSRKIVFDTFKNKDEKFFLDQGKQQEQAGANYIDLNAAALLDMEVEALRWIIPLLQRALSIPLSLDTPNPQAMEEGLKLHKGRALLNSLTGETKKTRCLLPLIRDFKPQVIVLCLDDRGLAKSSEHAVKIADRMANLLTREGIGLEDIFIDPLVKPLGVDPKAASLFLESLEVIKKNLPGVKTIAGLSNISFGLPQRKLLNRTFLILALGRGLDAAICDPLDRELQASLAASRALLGKDPSLKNYLGFIREKIRN